MSQTASFSIKICVLKYIRVSSHIVVQIRRGNRDNLKIIFLIILLHKNRHCDPSLEPSDLRGHNVCFPWEIRKIIFDLLSVPPLIWRSGHNHFLGNLCKVNSSFSREAGAWVAQWVKCWSSNYGFSSREQILPFENNPFQLQVKFFQTKQLGSLATVFHYHPLIILIWLK